MTQLVTFGTKGHYRKHLIAFLLLASIPGIIVSVILFMVSKSQMETELQEVHQNHVHNSVKAIDDQFSYLELLLAHWAFDSNFKESYENIDVVYNYEDVHKIYKTLLVMEGSNPLIERIELFVNQPNEVVFQKNRYDFIEETEHSDRYNQLVSHEKNLYWNQSFSSIGTSEGSLGLIHKLPGGEALPFGSLAVFLNKEKLADYVKSPYEQGTVYLFRNPEQWIFDNQVQHQPTAMQKAIFDEITKRTISSDSFLFEWDKHTYTVTYDHISRMGEKWYYVSAAPLTAITAPIVSISKLFIVLSIVMFVSAIILSLLASRKLYVPIDKLIQKVNGNKLTEVKNEFDLIETKWNSLSTDSKNLQKRLENQLPFLREGFLLQLIQGYLYSYGEKELQERMQQFGWEVNGKNYLVLFVQLYGYKKLKDRPVEGEEGLVTVLAADIIEDLIETSSIEADVINFHDLSFGLFLTFPNNHTHEEVNNNVVNLSENIITKINQIEKMEVSISISKITDSIRDVHALFEEAKTSLSYRNLQEHNQIIEIEKMDRLSRNERIEYPFALEKEITHAIRLRNEKEAVKLLHQFISVLADKNVSEAMLKQGTFQLLGSIFHVVLQSGLLDDVGNEGVSLYEQLCLLRDPDQISQWFETKVILPVIQELSQKQDQRQRLLVEKVAVLLQEEYMNDISLDYCADLIKMNPTILSKVFKDITGWNFIDYLTNIRIEKAKDLLMETDMKINCIAEKIGYKHSYFNRLFKKHEGVTPSHFREMNRKKII
jgi:AraC-like DNA-binding protein